VYNPGFMSGSSASSIEAEVIRIRELSKGGRHSEALAAAEALRNVAPENRHVLYLIAANLRCMNRIPDALEALQRLEKQHPQFSLLYQERGHCYTSLHDAPRAIDAFRRGVNLNAALVVSWSMLDRLYRMTGDAANAGGAAEQVAALKRLPPEVVQAGSLFSDGELPAAENILREYLRNAGDAVEALRLLGRIQHRHNVLDEAERLLSAALHLAPDYLAARLDYVRVLMDRGHSLQSAGRQKEAIESWRAAIALSPGFGDAWWSLANLKTYRFSGDELARMRTEEAASTVDAVDRYHLCFALGKAHEDWKEYAESWKFYERGNRLKRAELSYNPDLIEADTRKQIEVCTKQFFSRRADVGVPDADPIFIVGLPRSGSTLVEQILASHSLVEGTQELSDIPRIVQEMQGAGLALAGLTPEDFRRFGERYMTDTRAYRRDRPFFIDKMPNNFRHLGLIHLMLPNAKIIDVRREPMACCFSNLKQLFGKGQEFTYSIEDIARYYRTYLDLMRHWDSVLPGRILRVWYEDVVEDLEGNVRRILEFCGLKFEPQCMEFYKTERSVHTASSEQVRRPIFSDGLFQWRNYEPWLGPLTDNLGDALIRYRDEL
jgi:tetratricopeptide (TPR) repeat protein